MSKTTQVRKSQTDLSTPTPGSGKTRDRDGALPDGFLSGSLSDCPMAF